jgi:hypothetical protein
MPLKFRCQYRRDDQVILRVSPRALDRAFTATDPLFYASVNTFKVRQLMAIPDDDPVPVPIVGVIDGCISRSRTAGIAPVSRRGWDTRSSP